MSENFSVGCVRQCQPLRAINVIFALTEAFEERREPPARLGTAEVIACCKWGPRLRRHRHHHHLLLCLTGLKIKKQNGVQVNTGTPLSPSHLNGCLTVFTLLFCNTFKSSSWLCCVIRTLSAEVMQPLQAKQSLRVILAFSSFCFPPS